MSKLGTYKTSKHYKRFKKVINVLGWLLFAFLMTVALFLLLVLSLNKIAQSKNEKPMVGLYTIVSPSMTGSINVYDVVFVLRVPVSKIKRGDIITFKAEQTIFGDTPVTHRVIEKHTDDNGEIVFVTKGDYNQYKDEFYAYERNVVGKVLFKIPQLGRVQFFLVGGKGWFVAIILPALAIIAVDIFKVFKLYVQKIKMEEEQKQEEEEEKLK